MFKRRREHTTMRKFRELFWPSMGWVRAAQYARHRVIRLSASTHAVTAGIVSGMVVSFTPFFGFHFLLAAAMAKMVRGNILAALVGTFFGNPWTFPFLMWASYSSGAKFFRFCGWNRFIADSNPSHIQEIHTSALGFLTRNFWDMYLPTAAGSLFCILVFWPLFYGPVYYLVRAAQQARARRRHRKWQIRCAREARSVGAGEKLETPAKDG